jgi:hypothetical protein
VNQDLTAVLQMPIQSVAITGLFASVCNIYSRPGDPDAFVNDEGQVDLTNLVSVDGLQNIQCMRAPLVDGRVNPNFTERQADSTHEYQLTHVLLDGYYPAIEKRFFAEVDGDFYEIRNAEPDSQKTMTRLALRTYQL